MLSVVGGKFHACGIKSYDHGVICWGLSLKTSTKVPKGIKVFEIAAGNYFTCGILAAKSLEPICWGVGFPTSVPLAVSPRKCLSTPCSPGYYEIEKDQQKGDLICKDPNSHLCVPCSSVCPDEMYQKSGCNLKSDILCEYNCSVCSSPECFSNCSTSSSNAANGKKNERFWSMQLIVVVAEIVFAIFIVSVVSITAVMYVRYKLRGCECSTTALNSVKRLNVSSSVQKENGKIRPDAEEFKIRRAQKFTYEELENAT
ncbi:serine/threonine-protein kinase-like protein ACR4-like, partial [Trifolium medium]|nr:serine/threonine-protein kinase-like protein ACR4-like [Trifolium medium]